MKRKASGRRQGALAFGAVALVMLYATAAADERQTLEEHRALWRQAGLDAYVYAYNKFCECHPETPPETYVTVRGDEVVDVRHKPFGYEHYVQAEARNFEWYWTIEQLFDLASNALERGSVVQVEYDSTLGFPAHVFIDHDQDLIGDEVDVRVTQVNPVGE